MTVKTLATGSTFKLGRKLPKFYRRGLCLGNYLTFKYAPPPPKRDWTAAAAHSLDQIYLNNNLGDCVIACGAHWEGVVTGNSGRELKVYTDAEILSQYETIGGYVPGNASTDNGCEIQTALDYWHQHGFAGGTKIDTWVKVDGSNKTEVQAAINEFGYCVAGIALPAEWVSDMSKVVPGYVWDVAGDPVPENGHCVGFPGYDEEGVLVATWGMVIKMTWEAVAKYTVDEACGELYTLIDQDWIKAASTSSPSGFDWTQLKADIQSLG